jgi:hypothetical protein
MKRIGRTDELKDIPDGGGKGHWKMQSLIILLLNDNHQKMINLVLLILLTTHC